MLPGIKKPDVAPNGRKAQMTAQQQVLRATNEALCGVAGDTGSDAAEFVCECGAKDCRETIHLTRTEFEAFCAVANGTPLVAASHR
jgi:hypothetical protein